MRFKDRRMAGKQLGKTLRAYDGEDAVVYAIPRGGVVTGYEVARALDAPLDIIIARKIGHPASPEYAIAAVTENGDPVIDRTEAANVDAAWLARAIATARREAKRRREAYSGGIHPLSCGGKTAIIVDDGLATGLTMKAAAKELLARHPKRIIIAVPVAPKSVIAELSRLADEVVTLLSPNGSFEAVGAYYEKFPQITDEEVDSLLNAARVERKHGLRNCF